MKIQKSLQDLKSPRMQHNTHAAACEMPWVKQSLMKVQGFGDKEEIIHSLLLRTTWPHLNSRPFPGYVERSAGQLNQNTAAYYTGFG